MDAVQNNFTLNEGKLLEAYRNFFGKPYSAPRDAGERHGSAQGMVFLVTRYICPLGEYGFGMTQDGPISEDLEGTLCVLDNNLQAVGDFYAVEKETLFSPTQRTAMIRLGTTLGSKRHQETSASWIMALSTVAFILKTSPWSGYAGVMGEMTARHELCGSYNESLLRFAREAWFAVSNMEKMRS